MKERAKNKRFEEIDEHDLPTEPIPFPPFPAEAVPTPAPTERPFPHQAGYGAFPPGQSMQGPEPPAGVYPFLPPAPVVTRGGRHRPAGGAQPGLGPRTAGVDQSPIVPRLRTGRSPLPALVGLCFILVQFLLLARFVLVLFRITQGQTWIDAIYTLSSLFVLPFQILWQNLGLPQLANVELYTLVAIVVYGLLSRLIVRLLKTMLNSR